METVEVSPTTLSGPALGWAVATTLGLHVEAFAAWANKHGARGPAQVMVCPAPGEVYAYDPTRSMDGLNLVNARRVDFTWQSDTEVVARLAHPTGELYEASGPDLLTAGLRVIVLADHGAPVAVPKVLL